MQNIDKHYTNFYAEKKHTNLYPTEFVVRTFLAKYPDLQMEKLEEGAKVLDIGCGDGRNTLFLYQQGYEVYGTEITEEICNQTKLRLEKNGANYLDVRVGRNSKLPFEDDFADCILACHSCYYCDKNETIVDNLKEYNRVLKKKGVFITSVVHSESYILRGGINLEDGTTIVKNDPYNNRNGYRLQGFKSKNDIIKVFSPFFENFSFGQGHNNWYGIDENVWWLVCYNKK